jgi:hypothetical protein
VTEIAGGFSAYINPRHRESSLEIKIAISNRDKVSGDISHNRERV